MLILWLHLYMLAHGVQCRPVSIVEIPKHGRPKPKGLDPKKVKHMMERACLRKKNLSLEQANRIVDRAATEGTLLYFYKCRYCSSYHMTKSEPKYIEQPFEIR